MQVEETVSEGLRREFKVTLPSADIERRIEDKLVEVGRTAQIPGFRPGKVPLSLLRTRFGSAVRGEVLEGAVADSSAQTFAERGLRPAMQPEIEVTSFEDGGDLEYKIAVELLPDFEPMDFATLELERLDVEVPDSEVETQIANLAERHKHSQPLAEPRPSRAGDVLVVDFVGRIDGKDFPGGQAEDIHLELGAASFIPGFEDQLMGAEAGESKTVTVTFPDDYGNADLAGKEAAFEVAVKEVRESHAMEVGDELAAHVGVADLATLKTSVRQEVEKNYAELSRGRLKRQLFDLLDAGHDFPVPPGMVELEFKNVWEQVKRDREAGRGDPADEGKDTEALEAEYRTIAQRRVKLGLLLSEVGRRNNLEVSEEEIRRAIAQQAMRAPGREKKVMDFYRDHPTATESLVAPLLEEKVVDFMLEMARVTSRSVTPADLLALDTEEAEVEPEAEKPKPKKRARKKAAQKTDARKTDAKKTDAKKTDAKKTDD